MSTAAALKSPSDGSAQRRLDLRLFWPVMFGWAVCAAALSLPGGGLTLLAAGLLAVGVVACLVARRRRTPLPGGVVLGVVIALALVAAVGAHRGVREAGPITSLAAASAEVTVTGSVRSDPRQVTRTGEGPTPLVILTVDVETVKSRGATTPVRTSVLVFTDAQALDLRWGERVRIRGTLASAEPADDVAALLRASSAPSLIEGNNGVLRLADHVRARLREAARGLPADARGLVPAMVLGDRSQQSPELVSAMKATGLTHLSAVSGTNVTFVLLGALWLARLMAVPRRVRPVFGLIALTGFVILARPDPSVLRAAVMGTIGLLGVMRHRSGSATPALAGAMLVLLMGDPWLARSFGFTLSVLATAGLLIFARPWGEALAIRLPARARPLAFAIAIPAAAQVMCGPVIVLLQSSIPLMSIVANLLVGPLVAPVTLLGLAAALAAAVWLPAGVVLAWGAAAPAVLIGGAARGLAQVPGATLPWPGSVGGAVALALISAGLLVCTPLLTRIGRRLGRGRLLLLIGLAATLWTVWVVPLRQAPQTNGPWIVAACDVGQGDAIVLSTGSPGRAVLVDAGREPDLVDACLDSLGITNLDAVVLTHYDGDHVDGLPGVTRGRSAHQVLTAAAADAGGRPVVVHDFLATTGLTLDEVRAGDRRSWGDLHVQVVQPASVTAGASTNDASLVLDADRAGVRMLLLGDVEKDASASVLRRLEAELRRAPVDIVKVSHHGSSHVAPHLYTRLRAALAIISVGEENTYGHPTTRVLEELAGAGSVVWRTDQQGTALVTLEDPETRALGVAPLP